MPRPLIRSAELADLPRILALRNLALQSEKSLQFFEWEHQRSPFGPSPALVAEADGELVGLRIFLRWQFRSGDTTVPAVRAVDTAVHPEWRRQGLFARLTAELVERVRGEGVAFIFNTPNRRARAGYLKLGWRVVGRVALMARPLHLLRSGWRRWIARRAAEGPVPLTGFPTAAELLEQDGLEPLLADGNLRDQRPAYRTVRTPGYLRWRYAEIPGIDYRALWTFGEREQAAILFHSRLRGAFREIQISEILTGDGGEAAAAELIERLAGSVEADYLTAVAAPGGPERGALTRSGFFAAKVLAPALTARVLAPPDGGPDPLRSRSWNCCLGDLEIF